MENITKAIEKAVKLACGEVDYRKWWEDSFLAQKPYKTEEDLLTLSENDMTYVTHHWVCYKLSDVVKRTMELLGICYDDEKAYYTELEIFFSDSLRDYIGVAIRDMLQQRYFTERDFIHISTKKKETLEVMLNITGKELYDKYGIKRNETYSWTAYFNDGLEADIKVVFGDEDDTPYCEGVLFANEQEVCCIDGTDAGLFGTWEFEYQNKTYKVDFDDSMETCFNEIIDKCNDMMADEFYELSEFGITGDLTLLIRKDSDYNPDVDKDESNMVFIVTKRDGVAVDDSGNIHVTDLWNELYRLWHGLEFSTP